MTTLSDMDSDELLTVQDVAKLADLRVATIYQHKHRGTMPEPYMVAGQTPLWTRKSIEKWIATRRTNEGAKRGSQ